MVLILMCKYQAKNTRNRKKQDSLYSLKALNFRVKVLDK